MTNEELPAFRETLKFAVNGLYLIGAQAVVGEFGNSKKVCQVLIEKFDDGDPSNKFIVDLKEILKGVEDHNVDFVLFATEQVYDNMNALLGIAMVSKTIDEYRKGVIDWQKTVAFEMDEFKFAGNA